MRHLLTVIILLLSFCFVVPAQQRKTQNFRLDEKQPSVYLEFVRFGKLKPLYVGEPEERVFFRLRNNTRWAIWLQASGGAGGDDEAGMFYDFIKDNVIEITPRSYPCHVCSVIPLGSGKSLLFSVRQDHLVKDSRIQIHFTFAWQHPNEPFADETDFDGIISFHASSLPKENTEK